MVEGVMSKPLNANEAAAYLSLTKTYLYKLVYLGKIRAFKPGGKLVYFRAEDLEKYAFQNGRGSSSDLSEQADEVLNR
jgi:excisionase family DNA binding protein